MTNIQMVDPRLLHANPFNPNRVSPQNMEKLAKSITDRGFISAVVVRELPSGELQILGGQHRVETAVHLGLKAIPMINLGLVDDKEAKKVGLVDNARYGTDDGISLAKLYEDIEMSAAELASFLPFTEIEFDIIAKSIDVSLEDLDLLTEADDVVDPDAIKPRPPKTHDVLKFRLTLGDAERIRKMIEHTLKTEGLSDDDELTAAGSALAFLLLNSSDE